MRPRVLERGAGALCYTTYASVPCHAAHIFQSMVTSFFGHSLQCIEGVFCLIVIILVISFGWVGPIIIS